jgi:uncharacterized protein (DUF1697 family)
MRCVAGLLRGVNVLGRKVLMADLRRVTAEAGFEAPTTLLASGNVLFGTTLPAAETAARLEAAILEAIGVATEVTVRDGAELRAVIAAIPFPAQAKAQPSRLAVMFLNGPPQGDLASLAPACGLGEEVRLGPGCLYIYYPQGMGVSKLDNGLIERRLKVRGTARNWNTVCKVADLLA